MHKGRTGNSPALLLWRRGGASSGPHSMGLPTQAQHSGLCGETEEQGSVCSFRRQAETKQSGLCDDGPALAPSKRFGPGPKTLMAGAIHLPLPDKIRPEGSRRDLSRRDGRAPRRSGEGHRGSQGHAGRGQLISMHKGRTGNSPARLLWRRGQAPVLQGVSVIAGPRAVVAKRPCGASGRPRPTGGYRPGAVPRRRTGGRPHGAAPTGENGPILRRGGSQTRPHRRGDPAATGTGRRPLPGPAA